MENFSMSEVLSLLPVPDPPLNRPSYYIPCPCCDDSHKTRHGHLNVNLEKNVFRCPRCGLTGGVFDLYAQFTNTPREKVREELIRRLRYGEDGKTISAPKPKEKSQPSVTLSPLLDVDQRSATYGALLSKLTLAADHQQNLLDRGLPLEIVQRNAYRTTPLVGLRTLAKQLREEGHYLQGVPGFYRTDKGGWTFVENKRGILIPVRDQQNRIQGLQIRRDNIQKRKYRWLSSTQYPDGCPAEGWTHLAGPPRETVLLTEGPLKADIIYQLSGQSVLAVPGVNSLKQLSAALAGLRRMGTRKLMTCFDMDFLRNYHVQTGYAQLCSLLLSEGFRYGTYLWPPEYKGLDDYIWEYCLRRGK